MHLDRKHSACSGLNRSYRLKFFYHVKRSLQNVKKVILTSSRFGDILLPKKGGSPDETGYKTITEQRNKIKHKFG